MFDLSDCGWDYNITVKFIEVGCDDVGWVHIIQDRATGRLF
jgi:hypothetical protein